MFRSVRDYVRSSLARKFALAVVLVNIALVGMLGWEFLGRDRANLDYNRVTRAEGVANLLAAGAGEPAARGDRLELQHLAEAAARVKSVEGVVFRDSAGRIIARAGAATQPRHIPEADPSPFEEGPDARIVLRNEEAFVTAAQLRSGRRAIGSVHVRVTRADIVAAQRDLGFFGLVYGAAIVLLGGLIAFLTARSVTERLAKLAVVADRFRLGEHNVRFVDTLPDEVGSVSRGVNALLETIETSERSLNNVFRIAQIGSWRYFPSRERLEWSETVHQIFGLAPSDPPLTVEKFLQNLSGRQQGKLLRLLEAGRSDQIFSFNFTIQRRDGAQAICWAEARAEVCPETGERLLSGICQDITERETAAAQLRQAQKMEAVGQLTGGLAHDFNNLLAVMIGNLDLLEEQFAGDESAKECVAEALAAALRGSELTRQLLAFSRRQSLSPQRIDLNRLVAGMSSLWRRTLGEAVEVRVQLAEQLWPTRADPTQVESAILNLVINARDAMPDGGTLTVETSNMSVDDSQWNGEDNEIRAGDYSVVAVSDTGKGMSAEVVAKAFDPFFTTKPVGQGSGLGLSMIYGFASQSGGAVKIYSEPGEGTTVRLYLPRAGRVESADAEEAEASPQPRTGTETVLVVEDNDAVRRVAERQLGELGYKVVVARSGPEALDLLDQGLDVDLLFTDIVMPGGMNGFELGKLATERRPHLKVLHTSGFTHPAGRGSKDMPDVGLLAKPYRKVDLAVRIRQLLDPQLG